MSRVVIVLAAVILLSQSVLAFNTIDLKFLDQNFCPQTSQQNSSNIKTNPLLHTRYLKENYFIQKRRIEGQNKYVLFTPFARRELPSSFGEIKDFLIQNDLLFILTRDEIIEMSLRGKVLERFPIPQAMDFKTYARGFAFGEKNNALYITQGKLGLRVFELNSRSFTHLYPVNTINNSGHLSAAVAVAIDESTAYIVMTGRTEKGFNGIVSFDLNSKTIINLAEYDKRRVGVIYPYAKIYSYEESIFINNAGWIHEVSKSRTLSQTKIRPKWNAIAFERENYRQYIMLKGDFIFEDGKILGCGVYRTETNLHLGKAFLYKRR